MAHCVHIGEIRKIRWVQRLSWHASPYSVQLLLLLRAGGHHLVVISGESVSLGEVWKWRGDVWYVASEQDVARRHIKSPLCVIVQSWLSISSLSGYQLLAEHTTLSTVLLPSVYLQRTRRLRKLPSNNIRVFGFEIEKHNAWQRLDQFCSACCVCPIWITKSILANTVE